MTTLGIHPSTATTTPVAPARAGARRARAGSGLAAKLWRRVVFSAFATGLVGVAALANQLALYATGSP
jgi:hypothetical protein